MYAIIADLPCLLKPLIPSTHGGGTNACEGNYLNTNIPTNVPGIVRVLLLYIASYQYSVVRRSMTGPAVTAHMVAPEYPKNGRMLVELTFDYVDPEISGSIQRSHRPISFIRIKHTTSVDDILWADVFQFFIKSHDISKRSRWYKFGWTHNHVPHISIFESYDMFIYWW